MTGVLKCEPWTYPHIVQETEQKNEVLKRLILLIKDLDETPKSMSRKLGSENRVYNFIQNDRLPATDFLLALKEMLPQVNLNWILTGEGGMYDDLNPQNNVERLLGELVGQIKAGINVNLVKTGEGH